jgi:pyruvate ferredoxin oxidoreductase gamma subunit
VIEIIFHGRGGQGAVTSAEMLALAAIGEGKYAQAFPNFVAFARIDTKPIRLRTKIYTPDVAVVLDPSLLAIVNPAKGLKEGGILIINSHKSVAELRKQYGFTVRLAVVDATTIAREILGLPITNTTMLGALLIMTKVVEEKHLIEPLKNRFGKIAEKNINAMKRAMSETKTEV